MNVRALRVLLSAVAVLSFGRAAAAQTSAALAELKSAAGPSAAAAPVATPAALPVAASARLRAVAPGTDLAPRFSDPGRVTTILTIIADVYDGSPLPYGRDGIVFDNREGELPAEAKGYYHEYTVMPPAGSPLSLTVGDRTFKMEGPNGTRGAERLIIGAGDELYYTPDHYATFIPITVVR
jgi:ribonuclease T1